MSRLKQRLNNSIEASKIEINIIKSYNINFYGVIK